MNADKYIEQPHHFYASSFCTWKTSPDIREVMNYMEKEGHQYTLWYVPVDDKDTYEIKYYAPQVDGAFVLSTVTPKKRK